MKIQLTNISFLFVCCALFGCADGVKSTGSNGSGNTEKPVVVSTPEAQPTRSIERAKDQKVEIDGKLEDLVVASDIVTELVEDLKYATADNFMKRK
ncbi:MAG: hypothetical protein IPG58_15620, partial [Acidobacteria bacterium]|nr:hypothetical protein [Acidobacteriota bacterium]